MSESFVWPEHWCWLDRPAVHAEAALAGHVVVVLYWRLGCPFSRVALGEVAALAARHAGHAVAFVAVHVACCEEERDPERVRREVARLPGPVAIATTTRRDGLERTPTVLLLDEQHAVRRREVGVPRRQAFADEVDTLLRSADRSGRLSNVPFVPTAVRCAHQLSPAAIVAEHDRLWVVSRARGQVLECGHDGAVVRAIGSGACVANDGSSADASFVRAVAIDLFDQHVAVVDQGGQAVRAIDRDSGEVTTWCGSGRLGDDAVGGGYGRDQALSIPAGVAVQEGGVYVGMIGTSQLWQVDPFTGAAMAWLGNSGDGDLPLAAPSALAADVSDLWVVEQAAGRLVRVDLAHIERHVVASGFRRATAVVVDDDHLLVADGFDARIVTVDRDSGEQRPLFAREHGLVEPVAMSLCDGILWVADVGADAVFRADLGQSPLQLQRVPLVGLPELRPAVAAPFAHLCEPVRMREFSDVTVRIAIDGQPDGARVGVDVVDEGAPLLAVARDDVVEVVDGRIEVLLPINGPGDGALRVRLELQGVATTFVLPVAVDGAGDLDVELVEVDAVSGSR